MHARLDVRKCGDGWSSLNAWVTTAAGLKEKRLFPFSELSYRGGVVTDPEAARSGKSAFVGFAVAAGKGRSLPLIAALVLLKPLKIKKNCVWHGLC
ncbi:hypothetical protein D3C78_1815770 [compost metagenome]